MRRAGLLLALAACGSDDVPCFPVASSNITHRPISVASGATVIAASYGEMISMNAPIGHALLIAADGTASPEIAISVNARAKTGTTTALWSTGDDRSCFIASGSFEVTLQRGGDVMFITVEPAMTEGNAVVFDGTQYQLFWITVDGRIHHRSLTEDGVLGPVHDLVSDGSGPCMVAASDGAGTTLLRVDQNAYIVDPVAGTARLAFATSDVTPLTDTFWFAGRFHVHEGLELLSFPPTSTGTFARLRMPSYLADAEQFWPGSTTMLASSDGVIIEVDASLAKVRSVALADFEAGTFGGDYVHFVQHFADGATLTPGSIAIERERAWLRPLAVDSEVRMIEQCDDPSGVK